jgi:protoheme IX farnesyltransferase
MILTMRNICGFGKPSLFRNLSSPTYRLLKFQFCDKNKNDNSHKTNFLEQKDNFCFSKTSILDQTKNEEGLNDLNENNSNSKKEEVSRMNLVVVDDKLTCELDIKNEDSQELRKSFRKDVMELTKFKLCVLNTSVSVSTYALYSTNLHLMSDFLFFTGGTLCISMTSQVFNQIKEKLIDKKMRRTCGRPLPKQRMKDSTAVAIGGGLWASSLVFYSLSCPHAILFSNLIVLLYIKAYTPMKKNSNTSMHIGALVGALPALLGSYAATGEIFLESSMLLAGYIFAWQYPHFYGILYQNKEDYKKAGFNFISNNDDKTYIAYIQMIAAMFAMLYIVNKLHKSKDKIINDVCFIAYLAFYIKNFIPVLKFNSNPTKYAKSIRKESYMPFLIVLFSFIYNSYNMRKKNLKNDK